MLANVITTRLWVKQKINKCKTFKLKGPLKYFSYKWYSIGIRLNDIAPGYQLYAIDVREISYKRGGRQQHIRKDNTLAGMFNCRRASYIAQSIDVNRLVCFRLKKTSGANFFFSTIQSAGNAYSRCPIGILWVFLHQANVPGCFPFIFTFLYYALPAFTLIYVRGYGLSGFYG